MSVDKTSAAAQNRYIYFDGKLNLLSGSLLKLLFSTDPILKGFFPSILMEPFRSKGENNDERFLQYLTHSIKSFISRRLGDQIANNLISAVVHGIYAGDTDKLSIKSTFKSLWKMEKDYGSIAKAVLFGSKAETYRSANPNAQQFMDKISQKSIYSFKNGIQTLSDALYKKLNTFDHVTIIPGSCTKLDFSSLQPVVEVSDGQKISVNHVISGIPAWELVNILPETENTLKEELKQIEGVDVAVINLVYKNVKMPIEGFGFLVPPGQGLPVLGVVFDSCGFPQEQDEIILTVMMGGHLFSQLFGDVHTVSHELLKTCAVESVFKTLKLDPSQLVDCNVTVNEKCIPQYYVGHEERLDRIEAIQPKALSLIGASYKGVSLNDCIWNAKVSTETLRCSNS